MRDGVGVVHARSQPTQQHVPSVDVFYDTLGRECTLLMKLRYELLVFGGIRAY